jgi:para-aminobenzoate synthetase component 1
MGEPMFWMAGVLARDLLELSSDPASLDTPGFWAVTATFEGEWLCARFGQISKQELPAATWEPISTSWQSNLNQLQYEGYVGELRALISAGDVYQANACRIISTEHDASILGLFHEIIKSNPAPFASYLCLPDVEIACASPELFLKRSGETVMSSPIKGTSNSGEFGKKDQAENIMIVDLMRNDLGRICQPGSIEVPRLLGVEEHPGLFHLVSDVAGKLREQISWADIADALMPPGSVSGAPKSSALKAIAKFEPYERGPYCGALGWVNGDRALLAVAIRTFWQRNGRLNFGTGAGITWGSDPSAEWEETELKARRLISIANGAI